MKLSVIMPVYNEERTIKQILERVRKVDINKEIIVVDDGSTDATGQILEDAKGQGIRIIHHPKNMGKGAAIRTALKHVTGDIVIIQDGDLEYNPEYYPRLIEPILSGKSEVVYGSRVLGRSERSYLGYYFGDRLLTFIANLLYNARTTDVFTGYKVFRADLIKGLKLKCRRFEFCLEVTAKIRRRGYKIYEVPITIHPRSFEEGKKIRWKDGLIAIFTLIRYRIVMVIEA